MSIVLENNQRIKPPIGYGINWNDPITKSMAVCYMYNEFSGKNCFDLIKGGNKLAFTNTDPTWGRDRRLVCNGTAVGAQSSLPNHLKFGWPVTVISRFTILGTPSVNCGYFGTIYATNSSFSPYVGWQLATEASNYFVLNYNQGGNFTQLTATSFSPSSYVGKTIIMAGIITSSGATLYIDRITSSTVSSSYSDPTYFFDPLIQVGNWADVGRNSAAAFDYSLAFRRALSKKEIYRLIDDPYCFLDSKNEIFLNTASSPNDTATPSTLTLTATLRTPTISVDYSVLGVSSSNLTTTLQTPTVQYSGSVSPSVGSLNLTLQSPTVNYDSSQSVSAQSLTLTLFQPSITTTGSDEHQANTQTLALSLQEPSITTGFSHSVGSTLDLVLSVQTPTISISSTFEPSVLTLTLTLNSAEVASDISTYITYDPETNQLQVWKKGVKVAWW